MAKKKAEKNLSSVEKLEIGVGLTAAAVAAAGAYFLYGSKNASNNRKKVKSWALKAKAEVLEKLEDAQEMTEAEYKELVTAVAGAYSGVKSATKGDLKDFQREMMEHWQAIEKFAKPKRRAAKKQVKKAATAAKKTVKKARKTAKKAAKKTAKTTRKVAKKTTRKSK
jgi:colicin import membrane protein